MTLAVGRYYSKNDMVGYIYYIGLYMEFWEYVYV